MKILWEAAFNCLIDEERTIAFQRAIQNTVKPGDIVVDAGAGSGILSLFALSSGAKRLYCIERFPFSFRHLQATFEENGYRENVTLIKGDARKLQLPEPVNVIICEMIGTGLMDEHQIHVMNNLLQYAAPGVKVIISGLENYADLVYSEDKFYGHKVNLIRFEFCDLAKLKAIPLTEKVLYNYTDFTEISLEDKINASAKMTIKESGVINAIRISSKTIFSDGSTFGDSYAYCYPLILPVKQCEVNQGDNFMIHINYKMGGGRILNGGLKVTRIA